jgi:two-component system cell cycle response regulator DivK
MKTALIVEDNPVNRELLRELLEMRGFTVTEACDGKEALDEIRHSKPDIVLLDLNMPVFDGFEAVKRIRAEGGLAALPVLAVTAYAMRGDKERILKSGFDGYLSKPISPQDLESELQRLLHKAVC